jgi:hypothetical protein
LVWREQTIVLWFKEQYKWVTTNIWVFKGRVWESEKQNLWFKGTISENGNKNYGLRQQYNRIETNLWLREQYERIGTNLLV